MLILSIESDFPGKSAHHRHRPESKYAGFRVRYDGGLVSQLEVVETLP
jgi:hypothetical protein